MPARPGRLMGKRRIRASGGGEEAAAERVPGPDAAPQGPTVEQLERELQGEAEPASPVDAEEDTPESPTLEQLERELKVEQKRHFWTSIVRNTVFFLTVVAAAVVILVVFLFPVVQLEGTSMNPTLWDGDVIISVSGTKISAGDIIAFYHNNSIYVKRVVAVGGDTVNIDSDGVVYVNDQPLDEPYLEDRARGSCDIPMPYQVPLDQYFVLGDHRSASIDSRHAAVGCVGRDMVLGRVVWRIWPLDRLGSLTGGAG